ncbi:isochorismatase family protein [Govanella unica]|uniref:Isochorismatase family protein n=1 Tax=Govanella unica TaxID=2975056 RepID=A0A9X3Z7X8_9PROT|nr:isochorismatase family protein [Govania unica]MDA5194464.1 isochorismatase family protein [Govania unica]
MAGRDTVARDQDYAAAGFGGRLGFGERPALVIVDVVTAYLDPESPLYAGVEDELAANERLLAVAREVGIPVIFTRVEYTPGGADGGYFYKKVKALKVFDRGGKWGAFPATLTPLSSEIIVTKQYASAFFGTSLRSTLSALGVDTLLITGYSTSGCVRATALDALQNGFIPVVVADACGDRDCDVQAANLFDLAAKYADVLEADQVIAWLQEQFCAD